MPRITVITREGSKQVLEAETNRSVMEAVCGSGIHELAALCGGNCFCATCHVYVDPADFKRLAPMTESEELLLSASEHRRPGASRLACQIRVTETLEGLSVEIAPED